MQTQAIFAYGSLIDSHIRQWVAPSSNAGIPVEAMGISRGWWIGDPGEGITWLGADGQDKDALCNGLVFMVDAQDLDRLDDYESGYQRLSLPPESLTLIEPGTSLPEMPIWYYAVNERHIPSPRSPIRQSYVDTCLRGCLEVEANFPGAREYGFAAAFLRQTRDWSRHWLKDRPNAFTMMPQGEIDQLLRAELGMFAPLWDA